MAVVVLDLPPVRGRHRNRTLAKARQNRCVQLAAQGWTYEAIKDELGYASRSTAWRHVQQALAAQQSESIDKLRELAAGRLDALLSACWDQAMAWELAAVRSCLSVVLAQVKLMTWDHDWSGACSRRRWCCWRTTAAYEAALSTPDVERVTCAPASSDDRRGAR